MGPRWPYDMRPSVRAEKYIRDASGWRKDVTDGNDNWTDGQTDRQTDRRTDRVRRNMRPPPREEGRIKHTIDAWHWVVLDLQNMLRICYMYTLSQKKLCSISSNSMQRYLFIVWCLHSDCNGDTLRLTTCDGIVGRLRPGNVHMWFSSLSGYRPFITPPPALWN